MHFSWFNLFNIPYEYVHIPSAILAAIFVLLLAVSARKALSKVSTPGDLSPSFSVKGIFEFILDFINAIGKMVLGESAHFSVPIFTSMFLILFINNLVGLIPGLTPATENINSAFGLGVFSFLLYNFYGFKVNGWSYAKHFLGPVLLLAPLMLVIELVSHIVRPFSLGLRLSGNMAGDHAVLGLFLDLAPFGVPIIFYFLAIFVCFMQAFVFTMLSMIYLSMSIAHEH